MRVAITGTSGLAKIIKDTLEATPYQGDTIEVKTPAGIKNFEIKDVKYI